jgi:hypothetical protein
LGSENGSDVNMKSAAYASFQAAGAMTQEYDPPEYCAICGRSDERETRGDYLRTVYVRSSELDPGYYRPHLSEDEMFSVKAQGDREVRVCSNRKKCRARRRRLHESKAT